MMAKQGKLHFSGLAFALVLSVGCFHPAEDKLFLSEEYLQQGKVVLGSPRLTAGIPGTGPLARDEIKRWLENSKNHEPLDYVLPRGLMEAVDLIQIPRDNPVTRAKIELGRQLFFDKRLSGLGTFSCATCHQPEQSYTSYMIMPEVGRNASTVVNRLLGSEHFWDGRANSLESQPASPIENPFEMNSSAEKTTASVAAIEGYRLQFEAIFGEVSFANICRALASFERALVTSASPWDHHRLQRKIAQPATDTSPAQAIEFKSAAQPSNRHSLSAAAIRGETLFFSDRAGCGFCHTGVNLTDELYHNLGVGFDSPNPDMGRMKVTADVKDRGAFKTPSLRNVAKTPPYMHNGQFGSLAEVIDFIDRGGRENVDLSPMMRPLHLTSEEKNDLIEFLNSLTSALPPVETGRLPE